MISPGNGNKQLSNVSVSCVPGAGLEPARTNAHKILSLACLPIPPPWQVLAYCIFSHCTWTRSNPSKKYSRHVSTLTKATSFTTKIDLRTRIQYLWSEKRDSNPRPRPWQGRALPTELFSHRADQHVRSSQRQSNLRKSAGFSSTCKSLACCERYACKDW